MTALKEDSLFWQREDQGLKGIGSFMKGKGMSKPTWSPSQPQWTKGKSSQKGKGSKGQSKGKDPSWPKNCGTNALEIVDIPRMPNHQGRLDMQWQPPSRPMPNK